MPSSVEIATTGFNPAEPSQFDVFEDRDLDIASQCEISIDDPTAAVEASLVCSEIEPP